MKDEWKLAVVRLFQIWLFWAGLSFVFAIHRFELKGALIASVMTGVAGLTLCLFGAALLHFGEAFKEKMKKLTWKQKLMALLLVEIVMLFTSPDWQSFLEWSVVFAILLFTLISAGVIASHKCMLMFILLIIGGQLNAQNLVEFRGAPDSKYRYVDWAYTFPNQLAVDAFYIGVPGSNEFNLGGGYSFKASSFVLTPMIYAVISKEGQRSVKIALISSFEKDGWKANGFLAHNFSRRAADYQVLDTLDVVRVLNKRFEIGVSNGFFHQEKKWNPQIGPLLRINDRCGAWAVSFRFGEARELRITRVLIF